MTSGRNVNTLSTDWGTPRKYVDAVKEVFDGEIDLDPCSNQYSIVNAKIEYRLPENDGLKDSWNEERIYVNPPYGADKERGTNISHWLHRCALANELHQSEVIALLPTAANTDAWKHNIWGQARMICYLYDTRLKFLENGEEGGKGSPIQNCMVYWGTRYASKFQKEFLKYGAVVDILDLQKRKSIGGVKNISMADRAKIRKSAEYNRLKKPDLISLAEERGLSSDGNKADIIQRLMD